jgi:hypothetical protein
VTRHRRLIVLVALGLAVSSAPGTARAHPGHDQIDEAPARSAAPLAASGEADGARQPGSVALAARHATPPSVALAAGAFALLASFPNRRRTLALALTVLLAIVAFEGAAHAALHLGHSRHGDRLAIGVATAPPAVTDLHDPVPAAIPPVPREPAPQQDIVHATDRTVVLTQGRAPPPRQA